MTETLLDFLSVARGAGLPISVAESLDAFRTVAAIGFDDRDTLRDALSLVLAKTRDEKAVFAECFALYFSRDAGADPEVEAAARRAGLENIRLFTQAGTYTRRILDALRQAQGDGAPAQGDSGQADRARDLVERRLAIAARGTVRGRDEFLANAKLSNLDRRDFDRMRVIVRAMAKRLATRYGRERRVLRRGRLDVRTTIRRNVGHGGVPFVTAWKRRRIDKPRVMVLCDVSGSVATYAQFLLLFVFSLAEALSDLRAFAFSNRLIEVTDVLSREPVERAISVVLQKVGYGSTDYGRSFADFAGGWLSLVDRKTSVIILGDARSNYGDPRVDLFREIAARARRVVWLNNEPQFSWGTGDSVMPRYLPYCTTARVCRTVRDLDVTLEALLRAGR